METTKLFVVGTFLSIFMKHFYLFLFVVSCHIWSSCGSSGSLSQAAIDARPDIHSFDFVKESKGLFPEDSTIISSPYGLYEYDKEPYTDVRLLSSRVVYSTSLNRAKTEGDVVVRCLIDRNGKCVKGIVEKSTNELLDSGLLYALMETQFDPAQRAGKAVPCWLSIPVTRRNR